MTHFEKLTSEKYLAESMENELQQARDAQNEQAMKSFTTMTCLLAVFAITLYSALNFSSWVEMVKGWF